MALAPIRVPLTIGAIGGALTIIPALPLWFLGRCVFTDSVAYRLINPEALEVACQPIPALSVSAWGAVLAGLFILGLIYGIIHRYAVRHQWTWRPNGMVTRAVDLFAIITGPLLALAWAMHIPLMYGMTSPYAKLIIGLSPLAHVLWWRAFSMLATSLYARSTPSEFTTAAAIQVLLMQHFKLPALTSLQVECAGSIATVKGPFDAVDTERIKDLLANEYSVAVSVDLETTLSNDEYWRPYNEDLSRSDYVSPPIRPLEIPRLAVVGFVGVSIGLILVAFLQGPGIGLSSEDLQLFVSSTAGNVPEVNAVAGQTARENIEHEPFAINLPGSFDACPTLNRNALSRWRLGTETRVIGEYSNRVVRIHGLNLRYYVFVIDRGTQVCLEELEVETMDEARRVARRYTIGSAWEEIPMHHDWQHVPPIAR